MRKLRCRSAACAVPRWYGDVAVDERVLDLFELGVVVRPHHRPTLRLTASVPMTCSAASRASSASSTPSSARAAPRRCAAPSVGAGRVQYASRAGRHAAPATSGTRCVADVRRARSARRTRALAAAGRRASRTPGTIAAAGMPARAQLRGRVLGACGVAHHAARSSRVIGSRVAIDRDPPSSPAHSVHAARARAGRASVPSIE